MSTMQKQVEVYEDGKLADTVPVSMCLGRDSAGHVVRFLCAFAYLPPSYEERMFVAAAPAGATGGRIDATPGAGHYDSIRELLLGPGGPWYEFFYATPDEWAEFVSEAARRRYEARGPRALLPPAREVA